MSRGELIIHVGGPKTGTTAIQIALSENRQALRLLGILYPGDRWHHHNALYPIRKIVGFESFADDDAEAWKILCAEIQKWQDNVVISSEVLMFMPLEVINEIINDFGRRRVKILITARSTYELVISQWQESIKAGDVISLGEFSEDLIAGPTESKSSSHSFWQIANYSNPIKRWATKVGIENVIVQCVDVANGDATLRNFENISSIPSGSLGATNADYNNRSLSYSEAELIRMCNSLLLDGKNPNHLYNTIKPSVINEIVLRSAPVDDPKIELPTYYYESISPYVDAEVERIVNSGARIEGDPSLLTRVPQTTGDSRSTSVRIDLQLARIVLQSYLSI